MRGTQQGGKERYDEGVGKHPFTFIIMGSND